MSLVVGVPKEIKNHEYRVAMSPNGVAELVKVSAQVCVQTGAGGGIGISDSQYAAAGAQIVGSAQELFGKCNLIVKVKEPQQSEIAMLTPNHTVFSYLHLAPDPQQAAGLVKSGCYAIAFETVTSVDGALPLLTPMSEIAGKMAVQQGAFFLERPQGGKGVLLGGVAGTRRGKVVIIGGGVVGTQAGRVAIGMGANVVFFDRSLKRLRQLEDIFGHGAQYLYSTQDAVLTEISNADIVVGAVLIVGAAAPKIITRSMLSLMEPGSVIVDVAIDQGGCCETSRPTTHQDPVYVVDNILHYCVANIPGAVARTSSKALEAAILPYVLQLARHGIAGALKSDVHFKNGLNVAAGSVVNKEVAVALGYNYVSPDSYL